MRKNHGRGSQRLSIAERESRTRAGGDSRISVPVEDHFRVLLYVPGGFTNLVV